MSETPTQRIERIKREKASWSILDDIRRYAVEGFDAIPPDDLNVRLRAWGLYTQGDGLGVRGEATRHFMMRVRTPNGIVTSAMARTIADLSDRYARGSLDITNRQNFQLHWLRIEDVPAVWDALEAVGWTSMGACGDNTRTVTGCPLAGVDGAEIVDASPVALAVDRRMNGNPLYANLPRKFKISITGCAHWCTYPEINDIGLTAIRRGDEIGFSLRVGGGLSTRPRLADRLDAFVPWDAVPDVVDAVASIFRDSEELRVQRAKARMKFLFLTHGWTADQFLAALTHRLGYSLDPAVPENAPDGAFRDHVGIHAEKRNNAFYAGFTVASGRITPAALRDIAILADEYGSGELRTTAMQNIIILGIPTDRLSAFHRAAARSEAPPLEGSAFRRGILACTGSEYCKLAVAETKRFSLDLIPELERRLPGFQNHIKIFVTGCPNACGQHWIADIGLQGVADGFDIFVGGGLGAEAKFAQRTGVRVAAGDVADVLEPLFREYLGARGTDETFRGWTTRVGLDYVRSALETAPSQPS
ncbi:MAG TPA: nitrite/sulfite reductase [Gemmatimonadaceae bacterium]|nr:nitrite/sulfite reductase [Gemmatimonadaceae bacterium]